MLIPFLFEDNNLFNLLLLLMSIFKKTSWTYLISGSGFLAETN